MDINKSRILVFKKALHSGESLVFAHGSQNGFLFSRSSLITHTQFAQANGLDHLTPFDWAVGDTGRLCALFEYPKTKILTNSFEHLPENILWSSFPQLKKSLTHREDKRFLLLAIQYIVHGSVPEDLLASDNVPLTIKPE